MLKGWLYLHHARCPPDLAQCERRHGALGQDHRRLKQGLLDHYGAAGRQESRHRRRGRRPRQSARPSASVRSGDRQVQWQWDVTPPAGTPNVATGGMTWMTGTYDPELNLLYWGTGNPTPVLNGKPRPGDDLYTCSIVALNPDTGKLVWGFSASPHDTHDWDAVETPVLVDGDFHGQPRKMLMQTSRNGYFFVLDRTNGREPSDCSLRTRELDRSASIRKAIRFPIPPRNPRPTAASSRLTKAGSPTIARRASTQLPDSSSSTRIRVTASTSPSPPMATMAGPAPTTGCGARA